MKFQIKKFLSLITLLGQLVIGLAQDIQPKVTMSQLRQSPANKVWVVAHRGDWRHAPENSIQAIQNCILMGVDMVEIDVQITKDGHAVLMHDRKIDRTTTGKGLVSEWTLDSLQHLYLRDGLGVPTRHRIPTLQEALIACRGKILVNIDKGFDFFSTCLTDAEKTQMLDQILLKSNKSYTEVKAKLGDAFEKVHFMPVVHLDNADAITVLESHLAHYRPIAIEFIVPSGNHSLITKFGQYRSQGINVWVNALWAQHNDGHDDEKAVMNPHVYKWYLDNSINMIQTDRPSLLIDYLKQKH